MSGTKIEWTNETWNPIIGCSKVSAGCDNCYAINMANRLQSNPKTPQYKGLVKNGNWLGEVKCLPDKLLEPLKMKKPKMIFVCSMADLFHEKVPFEFIAAVYGIMAACPQHTFQVLTKRPDRMLEFYKWIEDQGEELQAGVGEVPPSGTPIPSACCSFLMENICIGKENYEDIELEMQQKIGKQRCNEVLNIRKWPLENVWAGTTIENQEMANKRVLDILKVPAAIIFVSVEPMLSEIDIGKYLQDINKDCDHYDDKPNQREIQEGVVDCFRPENPTGKCQRGLCVFDNIRTIDWIICGGETGPKARPMDPDWVTKLRDQCVENDTPFFFKQWGEWIVPKFSPKVMTSDNGMTSDKDYIYYKVGKNKSGNLINGEVWNQFPQTA